MKSTKDLQSYIGRRVSYNKNLATIVGIKSNGMSCDFLIQFDSKRGHDGGDYKVIYGSVPIGVSNLWWVSLSDLEFIHEPKTIYYEVF